MPYSIIERDGKYCVVKKDDGKTVACHNTRKKAQAQIGALMANEKSLDATLIYFGDAVKALDDQGRVGGYLIRFDNDAQQHDLLGEYFTNKTYLGPSDGNGTETLFDHGFPIWPKDAKGLDDSTLKQIEHLANINFAPMKTKRDALGIWAETVLDLSDEYQKAVFGFVKDKKLGWSSGAASHRVAKNKDGQIVRWPIAEGSLTPRPAEPRNMTMTLKSFFDGPEVPDKPQTKPPALAARLSQRIEDMADEGLSSEAIIKRLGNEAMMTVETVQQALVGQIRPTVPQLKAFARVLDVPYESLKGMGNGIKSIKDLFEEALAQHDMSRWQLDSVYCGIVSKLVTAAAASKLTGTEFDLNSKIEEATTGYAEHLSVLAKTQAEEYLDSESDEQFYLRALGDPSVEDFISAKNVDIEDHVAMVVSALRGAIARFQGNHEARVKVGRVLSEKNRSRLAKFLETISTAVSDCQKLLDETQPMASDEEKRLAQTNHLRLKRRLRELGATPHANFTRSP